MGSDVSNSKSQQDVASHSRAAARGTLMTLVLRLVSFLCTQATFRALDPSTLGKANIQLELLLTTVLFISREGFRLALTRNVSSENWNVAWLTIPVVTLVAGCSLVWHSVSGAASSDPDYQRAGILYCLASWIEGCAEPAVLYFLRQMDVPQRVSAEGLATLVKTAATVLLVQSVDASWQVTAFGMAQLLYAMTYASFLYAKTWSRLELPKLRGPFDRETCSMVGIFTLQGFFKHLLTEADRIVLATVSDSYDQGVYAMGSSYGGMAARILLQPLEENARLLWSRLSGSDRSSTAAKKELQDSYTTLVKLVLYIGLLFSCVAVNYTNLLLNLLAGRKWGSNAEAAGVLSAFCVYTAFLACNGMTEAFVYGVTASGVEIGRLGMSHTVTGVAFAMAAPGLVSSFGTVGLVVANCVAMAMRTLYSLHFAARYFVDQQPVRTASVSVMIRRLASTIIPHPTILLCFAASWMAGQWSLNQLRENGIHQALQLRDKEWLLLTGQHLAVGVSCVVGIASAIAALDKSFLRSLNSMIRPNRE